MTSRDGSQRMQMKVSPFIWCVTHVFLCDHELTNACAYFSVLLQNFSDIGEGINSRKLNTKPDWYSLHWPRQKPFQTNPTHRYNFHRKDAGKQTDDFYELCVYIMCSVNSYSFYLCFAEYRYYMYQKYPRILHCKYSVHICYMLFEFWIHNHVTVKVLGVDGKPMRTWEFKEHVHVLR